ncbi:MFS transporter [Brevibacillus sp. SYP-B805]|uniref:MFS transporter n=1 Tax=Brevibacillus sp. SYP-B805 TaxID=1578199 RepID=UPI0013E9A251|nr:MFS transporter [Brevibacillus sp. SYP-B805]NGQ95787.1 MFS transporter [Brevibacillus sp. SYP-B805]
MFEGSSLWAGVISGGMTQVQDTNAWANGQLDKTNYFIRTTGNVTGALGVMAGVEYGGILGTSILPGVGTVIGAILGGMLGDRIGRTVGYQAGNALFNTQITQNMMQPVTQQSTAQQPH